MKVISNRNNPRSDAKAVGFEMPSSLQHSLTTAIHGAFEVAVEIAVVEVTKLVSVAAGDMYEKIQQENETLKEELRKARSVIDSLCCEAGNSGEKNNQQLLQETNPAAAHNVDQFSPNRGKTEHNKDDGQCLTSQNDNFGLQKNNWASNSHEEEQNTGQTFCNSESIGNKMDIFHTCGVKVERLNQSSMSEDPPGVPLAEDQGPQFVKVKVENPEDIPVVKDVPVDSFKEDAISHLQSEIMQEWTLGACHFDEHDASPQANVHPSNMNFSLDTAHEPSTSLSNFPVRVPDRAPAQDPPPPPPAAALHAYKNNVRRNQGNAKLNFHTCKLCGLNFPLPSLLRRHFGQCQQKLNQRFFVPAVGGKRTKLQLYPPGCSPYRCTECDREFNRLENLKTHLRIHTGERPYKCSVCSTAFRHSGALTRHFRIHTGEKPYVCGLCGKSFRNCGGLKFHQRSHNK